MKKYVMGSLKFLFVDSTVKILGDLFEQPLIMWAFIGWGWLCILAIATSLGRGRPAQRLAAPFVLGLNGNAFTVTNTLAKALGADGALGDPIQLGERLKEVAAAARGDVCSWIRTRRRNS